VAGRVSLLQAIFISSWAGSTPRTAVGRHFSLHMASFQWFATEFRKCPADPVHIRVCLRSDSGTRQCNALCHSLGALSRHFVTSLVSSVCCDRVGIRNISRCQHCTLWSHEFDTLPVSDRVQRFLNFILQVTLAAVVQNEDRPQ
jgi:hypothetical protein